jgi:hypothetical protein
MSNVRFGPEVKIIDDVEPQSIHYALDISNASNIRQRQFVTSIADKTFYQVGSAGGVVATINIPASGYINGRESYLRFQLQQQLVDGTASNGLSTLSGSACNIIHAVRLRTPSSPDIENYQFVNHISQTVMENTMSKDFVDTRGQEQGYYRGYDAPSMRTNPGITGLRFGAGYASTYTFPATGEIGYSASVDLSKTADHAGGANYLVAGTGAVYADIKAVPLTIKDPDSTEAQLWSTNSTDVSKARYYTIPLRQILGFFEQDRWLPMKQLGGLVLEITFAPFTTAYLSPTADTKVVAASTTVQYSVNNLQLLADTIQLHDQAEFRVDALAKAPGHSLDIAYSTWDSQQKQITAAGSNIDLDIQKSLRDVSAVYATVRQTSMVNGALMGANNAMKSSATIANSNDAVKIDANYTGQSGAVITGYQWSLNSETFPVRKVQTMAEMYDLALKAWNKYSKTNGGPSFRQFRDFCFTMAVDLESDDLTAFAGKTVNAGSVLRLTVDVSDASATIGTAIAQGANTTIQTIGGLLITFMVKYTRVLRISEDRAPVVLS